MNFGSQSPDCVGLPTEHGNRGALDITAIILPLGFPLPGNPHVGENHDTCGQDFDPGGSRGLHLSGSGSPDQHQAEQRAGADLLDLSRKIAS